MTGTTEPSTEAEPTRAMSTQRLLVPAASHERGPLPRPSLGALLHALEASGLTGRGGAGFPTPIKVRVAAQGRRRPVVVGNVMEVEPLSSKDAVLLNRNPDLVLDGLVVLGRAMRARRVVLAVHEDLDAGPAETALAGRFVELARLTGGFVSGQESSLVNQLNGRPALPGDQLRRVSEIGVDGRPTLVLNAETLAHVALVVRHGAEWYRRAGTRQDPGTSLFTLSGSVQRPGVIEAPRGIRLADALAPARPVEVSAVLVGGYHGAWVPAADLEVRLTKTDLAPYRASVGAGVLHVLSTATCPLAFASHVVDYLATESARQCGPCVNGLPHLATYMRRLATCERDDNLPEDIHRMARQVSGRGACAHPGGSARFIASTLEVFSAHVEHHLQGWCPQRRQRRR